MTRPFAVRGPLLGVVAALALSALTTQADAARPRRRATVAAPSSGFAGGAAPSGTLLFVEHYGQSNSIGSGGTTVLSTSDPDGTTEAWNDTALVPHIEGSIGLGAVESHGAGFARSLTQRISGLHVYSEFSGVGAQPYSTLEAGTANYTTLTTEFGQMWDAVSDTDSPRRCAMVWIHGETDSENGVSAATYAGYLVDLQADFQATAVAAGCSAPVPLFVLQMSQHTQGSAGSRSEDGVAAGQWAACRDNNLIVCAASSYQFPMNADGLHRSNVGHRRAGSHIAKAIYWWLQYGLKWQPLHPDTIACDGTICTVDITGGGDSSNLVVNTSSVSFRYHAGFDYWDPSLDGSTDDMPVITSTSVSGRRVTLNFNRRVSSTGRIRYAYYGQALALQSPTLFGANGGNISNSFTWHARDEAVNLPDWLIGFDEAIDVCTNCTPSAITTFRSDLGLRTENSPDSGLMCGGGSMFSAATHATWIIWYRHVGAMATAEVIWAKNTTSQRTFDMRTGASDGSRIQMFVPTSANDTGTHWLSATGALSANTNYMIAVAYDGSQGTNDGKLDVYVCSGGSCSEISTAGAFTGTLPSALQTGREAEFTIGIGSDVSASAGDAILRHAMAWAGTDAGLTLSSAQVASVYNSGTPTNPITAVDPDPFVWLPLQGNLEDKGVASTPTKCRIVDDDAQWIVSP